MIVPETIVAEDVETLGQDGVLPLHLARGTGQRLLVLSNLLLQDLVHVGGHLDLLQALHLPLQDGSVLLRRSMRVVNLNMQRASDIILRDLAFNLHSLSLKCLRLQG